jgi:hypothetical protein
MSCFVILSEAKNLSLFLILHLNRREILRFAQNDSALSFSAAYSACWGSNLLSLNKFDRLKSVLLKNYARR